MRRTKKITLLIMVALIGSLAGCGGTNSESLVGEKNKHIQTESKENSSFSTFPKTITHLKGETVVEAKPIKIVAPYIAFVDYLAVLDEYPIAAQGVDMIRNNFPSLSERVKEKDIMDLGMEVDLERLLSAQPDLIIAADDMKDQYDKLSQIAPTVIFPQAGDWRETLLKIATVIGKEDKAESVLADFDRKSAEYKQQLTFRNEESVMFVMYGGKEQFITWTDGRFDPFYKGLGLKQVEGMISEGPLSLEGLVKLNPDHLFVINNWQTPVQGGVREAMKNSKVWNSLNAVKNNHMYELEDPSLPGPMALAKIDGIEEIMKALKK